MYGMMQVAPHEVLPPNVALIKLRLKKINKNDELDMKLKIPHEM